MRSVFVLFSILLLARSVLAATIHVPADQPTIQAGIDAAVSGDSVIVDPGTYIENLSLAGSSVVVMASGGPEVTIIEAFDPAQAVVSFDLGEPKGAEISGFTITGSTHTGVSCTNSSPAIKNNIITGNSSDETNTGAGIELTNTSGAFIHGNTIFGNAAVGYGCAMHFEGASDHDTVSYNLIYGGSGGHIEIRLLGGTVNNTLFHNNTISVSQGHGISQQSGGTIIVKNNIIFFSDARAVFDEGEAGNVIAEYNCTFANNNDYNFSPGIGNIYEDAQFNDTIANDYTLSIASPCIDAGDPDPQFNDPDGTRNDMGAFPYDSHIPITLIVPDDFASIQEAVDSALSGDTVLIRDGAYCEHVKIQSKDLSVIAENGPEYSEIISDTSRCFTITNSVITIMGLTLTGKITSGDGCAINISNGTLRLLRCDIVDSECSTIGATKGGAVYAINTDMNVCSCNISNNYLASHSYARGSGIYIEGKLSIDSTVIADNNIVTRQPEGGYLGQAFGGGIFVLGDSTKITNARITGNIVYGSGYGGGIYLEGNYFIIENSLIQDNSQFGYGRGGYRSYGGGLAILSNNGVLSNCKISANSVSAGSDAGLDTCYCLGGGLYIDGENTIMNCLIAGNSAISENWPTGSHITFAAGGGIYSTGYNSILNNTITANSARASCVNESNIAKSFGGGSYMDGIFENNVVVYNMVKSDCSQSNIPPEYWVEEMKGAGVYTTSSMNECDIYFANMGAEEWRGDNNVSNMNVDPLFCDTSAGDYSLMDVSPGVPENNECGEWIGAFEIGCTGKPVVTEYGLTSEDANHVGNNVPEFWWEYNCPLENPEDSFNIAIGTDNDWQYAEMWNPAPFSGPDTCVTYAGAALVDGGTYYLRLRVHNGLAWSDWYEMSFRMNSMPSVPVLLSPITSEVVGSTTPTLYLQNSTDAEGDLLTYDYFVYDDSEYVYAEVSGIGEQTDSTGWTVDIPMIDNSPYMWTVRANDGYEYSEWSLVEWFWVNSTEDYPTEFDLIFPPDTGWSQVYDIPTEFRWHQSFDPDPKDSVYYRLKVALDSNFTFSATYDSIYATTYLVPSLECNEHYWWKVYAIDTKDNMTQSSGVADFMTWILGDADADFGVNVADAVFLINYIFKGGEAPDPLKIGDINGDCQVHIGDAVYLISYIFKGGPEPQVGCVEE